MDVFEIIVYIMLIIVTVVYFILLRDYKKLCRLYSKLDIDSARLHGRFYQAEKITFDNARDIIKLQKDIFDCDIRIKGDN